MKTQTALSPTPPGGITTTTIERTPDLAAAIMAAKFARAQGCTEAARRLYDQALHLISQQPEPRRLSWLQRLGARP